MRHTLADTRVPHNRERMSSTPVAPKTRAARLRAERPSSSPAKSPNEKRPAVEEKRNESHGLTRKAINAKAMEGAAKYLDGEWGDVGGQFVAQRACAWIEKELEDPKPWTSERFAYYVKKVRADRRESDGVVAPEGGSAGGSPADSGTATGGASSATDAAPKKGGRPHADSPMKNKEQLHQARREAATLWEAEMRKPPRERTTRQRICTMVEAPTATIAPRRRTAMLPLPMRRVMKMMTTTTMTTTTTTRTTSRTRSTRTWTRSDVQAPGRQRPGTVARARAWRSHRRARSRGESPWGL